MHVRWALPSLWQWHGNGGNSIASYITTILATLAVYATSPKWLSYIEKSSYIKKKKKHAHGTLRC
jgi:hypothetical protein